MKTTITNYRTAPVHVLRPLVMKAPTPEVAPRLISNTRYEPSGYSGAELKPYTGRPDTAQALVLPSRTGNRLRYPDGRVTDLAGNPINESWSTL